MSVADGHGSAGGVTAVPYDRIAQVRLLDADGREVADSDIHGLVVWAIPAGLDLPRIG